MSDCQHLRLSRAIVGETAFYKCSDGWISVEERLPPKSGNYLVFCAQSVEEASFFADEKEWRSVATYGYASEHEHMYPTHWRALPDPPRESCHRNFTAEPLTIKVSYPEPQCVGYPGGCDGDLVGESHEPSCPAFTPEPRAEGRQ